MKMKKVKLLKPVSPGEMLQDEFLAPLGLTKYRLVKSIGVPAQRIGDIVSGKRGSPQIPICDCAVFSGFQMAGGCVCKLSRTQPWRNANWQLNWLRSFR